MQQDYDVVVIGAGQSGVPLSMALAKAGRKVALVERVHVGGTCINEGCTPTKTMVASARVAYLARRATDYGVHTGPVTVDMIRVRQRKRDIVDSFRDGSRGRIERAEGIDLIMGEAHFTGRAAARFELAVVLNDGATQAVTAAQVCINTGARPHMPDIPGLASVPHLDSTTIMELDHVPEHLLIVGGGYIGLEFGQMFCRFGSRVTIVQRGAQLLTQEDRDVADAVADILREEGVEVLLEAQTRQVTSKRDGAIRLAVETPGRERALSGSHLLVAAGRVPNTDHLKLDAVGVTTDRRGYIQVNERLETRVPGIYAMGDVKGGPAFTHISYDDFRILRTDLLQGGHAVTANRLVPYTVFIDPQLGRVGLSEEQARSQGHPVRVAKMPMSSVARAVEVDETRGFMKAVVNADTGQILGCAILGIEGGEIAALIEVAMMGGVPYTALRDGIFAHPTLAEALNNLFADLDV